VYKDFVKAKVVAKTIPLIDGVSNIRELIEYQAKVSNPEGQLKKTNLLDYLTENKHWSPFEMANIAVEVECPRDISRQILRHSTAKFQEFSQRYAEVTDDMFCVRELRRQDPSNRQNSIDDFSEQEKRDFEEDCEAIIQYALTFYHYWLRKGAAKECARVFLPEGLTMSRLYMNAPIRTWIHYLDLRGGNGTQKEHVWVAQAIRDAINKEEPGLLD